MSKRVAKLMNKYKKRDYEALFSLYKYRCLSMEQIYELHYKYSINGGKIVSIEYLKKKIASLRNDGFIESYKPIDGTLPTIFNISPDGIKALKIYFDNEFPSNVYDAQRRICRKGYLTYSEIKIANRFVAHQYHLNQFAIEARETLNKYNIENEYYDEKRIPVMYNIRPDAIIETEKIDIFLEMDMGSETLFQLTEKWRHYRAYLHKTHPEKPVAVFFICADRKRIEERMDLIKSTIKNDFIDCVDDNFELYMGTHKKLLAVLKSKIIVNMLGKENELLRSSKLYLLQKGFKAADASQFLSVTNQTHYSMFIKGEQVQKDFFVSEYYGEPFSAIKKAVFFESDIIGYKNTFNKPISLLLVGTNENMFIKMCRIFDVNNANIYFTTLNRLKRLPFNKAIFRVANDGTIFSFSPDFNSIEKSEILN